jgi:hypothetical protein
LADATHPFETDAPVQVELPAARLMPLQKEST